MNEQTPQDAPGETPEPLVVDSSKWGGIDLPNHIGDELDSLPQEERKEIAQVYRTIFIAVLAICVTAPLIVILTGIHLPGLGKVFVFALFLGLIGIGAAFRSRR